VWLLTVAVALRTRLRVVVVVVVTFVVLFAVRPLIVQLPPVPPPDPSLTILSTLSVLVTTWVQPEGGEADWNSMVVPEGKVGVASIVPAEVSWMTAPELSL